MGRVEDLGGENFLGGSKEQQKNPMAEGYIHMNCGILVGGFNPIEKY